MHCSFSYSSENVDATKIDCSERVQKLSVDIQVVLKVVDDTHCALTENDSEALVELRMSDYVLGLGLYIVVCVCTHPFNSTCYA